MVLVLILLVLAILGFLAWRRGRKTQLIYRKAKEERSNYYYNHSSSEDEGWLVGGGIVVFLALTALIVSCCAVAGSGYSNQGQANSIYSKIDILIAQRDELIPLVRDELATDEFEALMEATSTQSAQVQVIFTSNVSNVFLERANKIISLNAAIFNARNKALDLELEICSVRNNPFIPRLPGLYPQCRVEFLDKLMGEPAVSDR